ncbi:MAG: hypothetical protein KME05_06030 [Gloeocapsa sp. UFS-A4-WI-NPMV-4B04]|nr:hypothetical protein [Gloeocapsa sp. UFS-A4-WI-NPMV-4B04]
MKHFVSIAIVISSVLLVLTSIYLPVTIYSQAQLAEVKLGLVLPFVVQTQYINPPLFPWQTSIRSIWENPTQVLWPQFFLDVLIVFGGVSLVFKFFKARFLSMSRH